ncbi:hypothetical protein [Oricola indica]|uniref:hypothetical protein n=1 Tax=Oricola indica TaxID=2872591 RepID=UPI003CCB86DA
MSSGNRYTDIAPYLIAVIGVALVGLVYLSYAVSKGYERADQRHQSEIAQYATQQQHQQECLASSVAIDDFRQCLAAYEGTSREHDRAEQNLNAQREMAYWAEGMLWATWASVIITAIGVVYVALTLKETQEAVRAADDAVKATFDVGTAQIRAHLIVSDVVAEYGAHSEYGRYISVTVSIRNVGQTPAIHVDSYVHITEGIFVDENGQALKDKWTPVPSSLSIRPDQYREIPPGEKREIYRATITADEFWTIQNLDCLSCRIAIQVKYDAIVSERRWILQERFDLREHAEDTRIGAYRVHPNQA